MRIITGKYKGRHFDIPRGFKARPTTDFAKENLFNVLSGMLDFEGVATLDLFSGTGGISMELLSRGCATATMVEADREHAAFIRECIDRLGADNARVVRGDAFVFIRRAKEQYGFVFADPPYSLPRLAEVPGLVLSSGLVEKGGVFVMEHGAKDDFSRLPQFVERRAYGSVNFSIFRA